MGAARCQGCHTTSVTGASLKDARITSSITNRPLDVAGLAAAFHKGQMATVNIDRSALQQWVALAAQ